MKSGYKKLRDLRVLRGRQVLYRVTGASSPAEGFVVSSAERAGPLGFLRAHTSRSRADEVLTMSEWQSNLPLHEFLKEQSGRVSAHELGG